MYKLKNNVMNYEWGKIGNKSIISKFISNINENLPYAEMWMGTHKKAMSKVLINNKYIPLNDYLGYNLSFLFKILSIRTALSIQVHPDKETAEKLNKKYPNIYVDDNHKPEMVYPLTNFEALCGFQSNNEIAYNLFQFKEFLEKIIDYDLLYRFLSYKKDDDMKEIFYQLMKSKNTSVISSIVKNIYKLPKLKELVLRIYKQYNMDIGILALLFLNYVKLNIGEVMFLKANVPHAYISGDCLEVMATSDNVIRCGLTSKLRDVELLCNILDYDYKKPNYVEKRNNIFYPDVKDFAMMVLDLNKEKHKIELNSDCHSILLVVKGELKMNGKNIKMGESYILDKKINGILESDMVSKVVICFKPTEK